MGLCASVLRRRARHRHPEPRRGTPTAMYVVRGDRRPEPLVLRVQDSGSGRAQLHKPPASAAPRRHERCSSRQQGADAPDRTVSWAQAPRSGTTARSTGGVEHGAPPSTRRTATATAPTTTASPLIVPGTPASAAAMTPGRPVWQRRILMGMRCELPRFSGLLLYDEHGRPVHVATPGRRNHRQGKKKTAVNRQTQVM